MSTLDSVLLIAFGGPESPDDIRPFLRNVAAGRPIPPERLEEVAHHYERIGGRSPLNALTRPSRVMLHTDSQYVQKGITEWLRGWKARGWRTASKEPVKNVDLWKKLDEAVQDHHIRWVWVKGHSGHDGNERADALANKGVASLR